MANLGTFDIHTKTLPWFDVTAEPNGWFTEELIAEAAAGGPVTADLSASIPVPTLISDVDIVLGAALTANTPVPTLAASATIDIQATLDANVPVPTLDASGTITNPMVVSLTSNVPVPTLVSSYSEITTPAPPAPAKPTPGVWYINRRGRIVPYTPPRWRRSA